LLHGQSTYPGITDLINNNLANGSKITAPKHREVEIALLNYYTYKKTYHKAEILGD
jgi:hypothetical protein